MQVELAHPGRNWRHYAAIIGLVILFIALPMFALLYFQDEIKQAQTYGYLGVFVVGILCGISIIPTPTQILVFTFGHILNPVWVGLIAGLGAAIGGITVYLTGAGVQTLVSRLRSREKAFEQRLGLVKDVEGLAGNRFWAKGKVFYEKVSDWISGKRGAWALFITSALVFSPFYPAGLAAGSLHMGLVKFFLISWAGKTVRYLFVALAGNWGLQFVLNFMK